MIDRKFIGKQEPVVSIEVEKYPIRFFAEAIGATERIHFDEDAARAAGYRSLVAPPTYVMCLGSLAEPDNSRMLIEMGIDPARVLHGEQHFDYHQPVCAGDRLEYRTRVTDIYEKKGGALGFVALETGVTNQTGAAVAEMRLTIVVRN